MEETKTMALLEAEHKDIDVHARASESQSSTTSILPALQYRDAYDDDDDEETTEHYFPERWRQRTFVGRVLGLLGMNVRQRRRQSTDPIREYSKEGSLLKGKPRHASPRENRKCRRGGVAGFVRRVCLAVPVVVLMFL